MDDWAASAAVDASQFDLLGFSQGASLAYTIAFLYPRRVGKMGGLSGFAPGSAAELASIKPLRGKHIFVVHGTRDDLVPLERAQESISILKQAGAQVTYCEAEFGHKISAGCYRGLEAYFG